VIEETQFSTTFIKESNMDKKTLALLALAPLTAVAMLSAVGLRLALVDAERRQRRDDHTKDILLSRLEEADRRRKKAAEYCNLHHCEKW